MITTLFKITIIVPLLLSLAYAQTRKLDPSEIESLRMLNHNNLPVKVLVYYYDDIFVDTLFNTIIDINQQEGLSGTRHEIKMITIGYDQPSPLLTDDVLEYHRHFEVGGDLWLQDWGEVMVAKQYGDNKERLFIFDTNRGRGLADLPEFLAKVWNAEYYYKLSSYNGSGNYGGNLEVTPNNVLWIGSTTNGELRDFLVDKGYSNNHVILDTDWLIVGHVDEHLSQVVLDSNDPCGFAIVKADVDLAFELTKKASDEDFDALPLDDSYDYDMKSLLVMAAKDLQGKGSSHKSQLFIKQNRHVAQIIESNLEQLKQAVARKSPQCQNIKVISFPTLFNCTDEYYGEDIEGTRSCAALLPGTANMLVLRNHQLIPDPFFPPFKEHIQNVLEANGQHPHFIDDRTYHHRLGEVHCGTNVMRLPNEYLNDMID